MVSLRTWGVARGGLTPKSFSVRESHLDLTRGPSLGTPPRERISPRDGITRRLNGDYWRRHAKLSDHNERGLLDGGPDEFSGNLQNFIADSLSGATPESPKAALNRMKLRRINARRKARQRDAFVRAFLATGYAPRAR